MELDNHKSDLKQLINEIKSIVSTSKSKIEKTVNEELLYTYWQIGKIIVDREQKQKISARKLVLDLSKEQ